MNPPPSYQEILQLLNKTKTSEMRLIDENAELKRELETAKLEIKVKTDELVLFYNAYKETKKSEYILRSKL